jgi:hypothetical protein
MSESASNIKEVPEEFSRVIKDFVNDIKITFPEYLPIINKWWKDSSYFDYIEQEEERTKAIQQSEKTSSGILFSFCQKKYPVKFFEILYQNEEIFNEDSVVDTEFLPHIHFKDLWQFDITDKTRETIWKYLQLIMFSIINTIENKEAFGDSAKLFEAINEGDFKNKLEETMTKMQEIFNMKTSGGDDNDGTDGDHGNAGGDSNADGMGTNFGSNMNMGDLPNPADLHEHITGMLEGKLGKLAKEIAEETAENLDLGIDMDGSADMKDIFNKLVKNPGKLMGLVKNVGEKLDTRIKSGEIKESELIAEATEIMNRMKSMPGMDGIQEMLSKMGMSASGLGKGGKVNYGAMEAELNKKMKIAKMKERMHAKSEMNKAAKERQTQQSQTASKPAMSEEELIALFNKGEKSEKTPRNSNPNNQTSTQSPVQNTNTTSTTSTKSKNNKKKGKK